MPCRYPVRQQETPGKRCALEDKGRLLRKDGWTGSETADEFHTMRIER